MRPSDIPAGFPFRERIVEGKPILFAGGSMIVAAGGEVLAGPVIEEECILYADVDRERVLGERLKLDPAGHYGRPDVLWLEVTRKRHDPGA